MMMGLQKGIPSPEVMQLSGCFTFEAEAWYAAAQAIFQARLQARFWTI